MTTKIQKWGNSLAMRLPKELSKSLNWGEGVVVGFKKSGNGLIVTPSRAEYTVQDMLKGINKKNRHKSLWPNDKPRGKEIW